MNELDLHEKTMATLLRKTTVSAPGGVRKHGPDTEVGSFEVSVQDVTSAMRRTPTGTNVTRALRARTRDMTEIRQGDRLRLATFAGESGLELEVESAKRFDLPGYAGQQITLVSELK